MERIDQSHAQWRSQNEAEEAMPPTRNKLDKILLVLY